MLSCLRGQNCERYRSRNRNAEKADVRVLDPTVASLSCYKNQDVVNQLSSYLP